MATLVIVCSILAALTILQLVQNRYKKGLRSIPGPFVASISDLWKVNAVYQEDMPRRNMAVHEKYGPVVRIGPNHVSCSSLDALNIINRSKEAFAKVKDGSFLGKCL